jgi:energy-coupling factor transporter ATP-binding protein EcfA2
LADATCSKIGLPTIERVSLDDFDLYTICPDNDIEVSRSVFCLIGANGLGKSTFLNTINYVITGAIPAPNRKFQSAQGYWEDASRADKAEDYFSGRLSERVRPLASGTVELGWNGFSVAVTREIFGTGRVIRIVTTDQDTGVSKEFTEQDPIDLNATYQGIVLERTGLDEFAQFVFLSHFVETFDEGRHLLMWDDTALTNALYLAFGADPADARAADKLQHDMERESSRGRNVRYSARHVSERINQLTELLARNSDEEHKSERELEIELEQLTGRLNDAQERARRKRTELRDADAKFVDKSAQLTEAQLEYRRLFSSRLHNASSVEHHPLVRTTVTEDRCALCGTAHVGALVSARLAEHDCPLCDSKLVGGGADDDVVTSLRALDLRASSLRVELEEMLEVRQRLSDQLEAAEAHEESCRTQLGEFQNAEASGLAAIGSGGSFSAIQKEVERLEKERQAFVDQSRGHYRKRDDYRERLRRYEKRLRLQYEAGSQLFVPRFRELAESFIGLPIDIELEARPGANEAGFGLSMRMDGQVRLQPEDVSESQRFFIDIALRMALAEFMTDGPATLLVDTPEGSLDIAYEARAGIMLSKFASEGNRIIMTANLRSSQLVLRLAGLQKEAGMQVIRMTDWTDLSEVQQTEEGLFTKAYEEIEAALR